MTGYVYAIDNGRGHVKIGWAKEPLRRLAELNVACSEPMRLLGYVEGTRDHEAALHQLFRRYNGRGEWFRIEGAVKTFLEVLPKPHQSHAAPKPTRCDDSIESVGDVFSAFGGIGAVASILGKNYSTCAAMKRRGAIASWHFKALIDAAKKRGIEGITVERLVALHSETPQYKEAAE